MAGAGYGGYVLYVAKVIGTCYIHGRDAPVLPRKPFGYLLRGYVAGNVALLIVWVQPFYAYIKQRACVYECLVRVASGQYNGLFAALRRI